MKQKKKPSSPTVLSQSTHERLSLYVLAATSAAGGFLAPASSEAKVVYTPAQIEILGSVPLDLNGDGIADFNLVAGGFYSEHLTTSNLQAAPNNPANLVLGHKRDRFVFNLVTVADALPSGAEVGPNLQAFQPPGQKFMGGYFFDLGTGTRNRSFVGGFANSGNTVAEHFLGLAFTISGQTHFGWARVSVSGHRHRIAALTGYAYETIPDTPIITGRTNDQTLAPAASLTTPAATADARAQVPMLGALALGSDGLAIRRRDQSSVARLPIQTTS